MTPEEREALWNNLPDAHKKIEDRARFVLVKREEPERVWVPLRDLTTAEFHYLKAFAWAQRWKRDRELRKQIELRKQKR